VRDTLESTRLPCWPKRLCGCRVGSTGLGLFKRVIYFEMSVVGRPGLGFITGRLCDVCLLSLISSGPRAYPVVRNLRESLAGVGGQRSGHIWV